MKLAYLSVTNYRSIQHADRLPFGSSITTLLGPNNEGKSNIVRAMVLGLVTMRSADHRAILRSYPRLTIDTDRRKLTIWTRARHPRVADGDEFLYSRERDFPLQRQGVDTNKPSVIKLNFELTKGESQLLKKRCANFECKSIEITLEFRRDFTAMSASIDRRNVPGNMVNIVTSFINDRIDHQYIPSLRTARIAREVVEDLVAKSLSNLEGDRAYIKAQSLIEKSQKPILREISKTVTRSLKEFIPNVNVVTVSIPQENRYRALKKSCVVTVNDGVETNLQYKGDGVQSLAALSLMRHVSMLGASGRSLILAVEEPESHLHPGAIHQLREIFKEMASKHQVILTTHNPLFVARDNLSSNIIVSNNKAQPADSMETIRNTLGVQPSDNLQHAELVLLVEGDNDKIALSELLPILVQSLANELNSQMLVIESLMGASKLISRLRQLRNTLCLHHCLLDNDQEGNKAYKDAVETGLLTQADVTLAICKGMRESEIEDSYRVDVYKDAIKKKFGVELDASEFKGKRKWSERIKATFTSQGKQWDDQVKAQVKLVVAQSVRNNAVQSLIPQKSTSLKYLAKSIASKLKDYRQQRK